MENIDIIPILDWFRTHWDWILSAAGGLLALFGIGVGSRHAIRKTVTKRVEELEVKMKGQPGVDEAQNKRLNSIENTLGAHRDQLTTLAHGQELLQQQFTMTNERADERHKDVKESLNLILSRLK